MAVKMRLARAGSKKRPYYHIVIADAAYPWQSAGGIETVATGAKQLEVRLQCSRQPRRL